MKYLLLYNPVSGKGKFTHKISYIKSEFCKRGLQLDIYESKNSKDLIAVAKLEAPNYYCFLVAGGDGTVNEVVNGVKQSTASPVLAFLSAGTANDTSAILGMKKNIKKSLKLVFENKPVLMDVNKINDHYFIYATAAGILTKISYDIKREDIEKYGYFAYLAEGVKDLTKTYQMDMEIIYDGGTIKGKYMLLLGLSAKRVGGFNLWNFSKAKLNDGLLEIRLMSYTKKSKLFRLLTFFLSSGRRYRTDVHLKSSKYKIKTNDEVIWNVDGEKGHMGNSEITVIKEGLNVIVGRKTKKHLFDQK